jgi:4-amino-4-deoxy-L-arabinose transferase-like glycosyltransferase
MDRLSSFLIKYEKLIPLLLLLLFFLVTVPGISWGAPEVWNVDELVYRVERAFTHGDYSYFDTTNFIYPSLPKYVMYGIGLVVYGLKYSTGEFVIASRLVSVLLGGLIVVMTYSLTRKLGGGILAGLFAALLVVSGSAVTHNARFAHNDLYLAFFVVLTVYCLVQYFSSDARLWLYAAFAGVGLAASSKYNGIILLPAPFILYGIARGKDLLRSVLTTVETLFIGCALVFLGYALGTPKALFWMAFYFKRMIPAFLGHRTYGYFPGAVTGLVGQWRVLESSVGGAVYFLFIAAFLWFAAKVAREIHRKQFSQTAGLRLVFVILLALFIFDIQFWVSYIFYERFFVPMIPLFSVLAALFVQDIVGLAAQRGLTYAPAVVFAVGAFIVAYSFLRVSSVMLLFMNDPRIQAYEFVRALPAGSSLEWTKYTPFIHDEHLGRRERLIPCGLEAGCNDAETVLIERHTDYLVVDSFTYGSFNDKRTCELYPIDCDLFSRLLAGKTQYQIIASFPSYTLPPYLPQLQISFVNPEIKIFELAK